MSPLNPLATAGHVLLEQWLVARYGRGHRTTGPGWSGIQEFRDDLEDEHARLGLSLPFHIPVGPRAVYGWLPRATNLTTPRAQARMALAVLSHQAVPERAWDERAGVAEGSS